MSRNSQITDFTIMETREWKRQGKPFTSLSLPFPFIYCSSSLFSLSSFSPFHSFSSFPSLWTIFPLNNWFLSFPLSCFFLFILFYFILFYFILFYFILFYFILFYFILFYFILFYFVLFIYSLCKLLKSSRRGKICPQPYDGIIEE